MQSPLQILSPHVALTGETEAYIRERTEHLETFFDGIVSCRVSVDGPVEHHRDGGPYTVRIDLTVPGSELVVSNRNGENLHSAIRGSFEAMRKQLVEYAERRRATRRGHEAPPRGRVVRIDPDGDFGFLQTEDGRTIYFHRNSVLNGGFDALEVGAEVIYAEEMGDEGPQASTVTPAGGR